MGKDYFNQEIPHLKYDLWCWEQAIAQFREILSVLQFMNVFLRGWHRRAQQKFFTVFRTGFTNLNQEIWNSVKHMLFP